MDQLIKLLKCVGLLAVTITVVTVGGYVCDVLIETKATAVKTQEVLTEAQRRIKDTSQNANAILIQVGLAADEWRRASESSKSYNQKVTKILDDSDAMLVATNEKLSNVLDQTAATMGDIGVVSKRLEGDVKPALDAATISFNNISVAAGNVALTVADPSIQKTLVNIEATTENLKTTSDELISIGKHIDNSTANIDKAVERSTRPATFAAKAGLMVLSSMGAVGTFLKGVLNR